MNTYSIEMHGYSGDTWSYSAIGETPGKAKYALYQQLGPVPAKLLSEEK